MFLLPRKHGQNGLGEKAEQTDTGCSWYRDRSCRNLPAETAEDEEQSDAAATENAAATEDDAATEEDAATVDAASRNMEVFLLLLLLLCPHLSAHH